MAKEGQNLAADKTNQDFKPDQLRIDSLMQLKNFCDTEIKICQEAIEGIKNPTNQYLTNLQQAVKQPQQKIETLNKELTKQKELQNTKWTEYTTQRTTVNAINKKINDLEEDSNENLKQQPQETQNLYKQLQETQNLYKQLQETQNLYKLEHEKLNTLGEEKEAIDKHIESLQNSINDATKTLQKEVNTIQAQIQQTQEYEPRRKNLQEAMKNPNHPLARDVKRIRRRQKVASEALGFINQAIENEKKFYSTERMEHISVAMNTINSQVRTPHRAYLSLQDHNKYYKTASLDQVINYATNSILSAEFEIFLHQAEKLAKARNDDERYQPLKDIMDAMIIILAKASSMAMPAGLVDITIKALGAIGGHLADIIKEDFMAIRDNHQNLTTLVALNKKKEELEISINNMKSACKDQEYQIMLSLTEKAVMLGLLGRSNYDTTEDFIVKVESSIKEIQTPDENGKLLQRAAEYKTKDQIPSLCEQATEDIAKYKALISPIQKAKEKLDSLPEVLIDTERKERKSTQQMVKETKENRDKTYTEKVRTAQQKHQAQFSTR